MIDLKAHSVKEIKEWLYHGSDDVSSLLKAMQEDSRISVQKEAARYMKHLVAMEKNGSDWIRCTLWKRPITMMTYTISLESMKQDVVRLQALSW